MVSEVIAIVTTSAVMLTKLIVVPMGYATADAAGIVYVLTVVSAAG
jgi:hypothetical protein